MKMRFRLNTANLLIIIMSIIYLFADFFRSSICMVLHLDNIPYLGTINFFAIIIILYCFNTKRILILRNNRLSILLFFIILCMISFSVGRSHFNNIPAYFLTLILPMLLMNCNFKNINWQAFFRKFLIFFNTFTYIILVYGFLDYILGGAINAWMCDHFFIESIVDSITSIYNTNYRLVTPWGPSLFNAFIFIVFLIINTIDNTKNIKSQFRMYWIYIVTMFGIVLCGSKVALICVIFYIAVTRFEEKNKVLNILLTSLFLFVIFSSDFFQENIWRRIIEQYISGDLTTGRSYIISFIFSGKIELPGIFFGQGAGYSRALSSQLNTLFGTATNFEYPLIMLAYDYGIIATLIYVYLMFIFPIVSLFQKKNKVMAWGYLVIVIYLNSFNGLADLNYDFNYKLMTLYLCLVYAGEAEDLEINSKQFILRGELVYGK